MTLHDCIDVGGVAGICISSRKDRVQFRSTGSLFILLTDMRCTLVRFGDWLIKRTSMTRENLTSVTGMLVLLMMSACTGICCPGTKPACGIFNSNFNGSVVQGPQQYDLYASLVQGICKSLPGGYFGFSEE